MSYRVRIESFEGPFDLLLYLVSRQKVDIGSISITQIADQYLAEVSRMKALDLDVASDFLLVASTLLKMKAESLLPKERTTLFDDAELDELEPSQARDMLVEKLLVYKQFKGASAALEARARAQERMHARTAGPDDELRHAKPDYLENVTLSKLGTLAAAAFARREAALLESEHIAAKPIPVEDHVRSIHARLKEQGSVRFSQLVKKGAPAALVVVTFLAVLELYKRSMANVSQDALFGDITIEYMEGPEGAGNAGSEGMGTTQTKEGE